MAIALWVLSAVALVLLAGGLILRHWAGKPISTFEPRPMGREYSPYDPDDPEYIG